MNIKELVFIVVISLVTAFGIEYLFLGKRTPSPEAAAQSGQRFVAPKTEQELKPLNTEIDFLDTNQSGETVKTIVETPHAQWIFSNHGAILDQFSFKRETNGEHRMITTISPVLESDRESKAFLVALNDKTPYFYTLTARRDNDQTVDLEYTADFDEAIIIKKFVVHKANYKMNLTVTIKPKNETKPLQARIFYPAPIMPTLSASDVISGVMNNEKGDVTKIAAKSLDIHAGWFKPTLFGLDNRYFLHAMVEDPEHFAQRGYYKKAGNDLFAIVEGPELTKEQSWTVSFYVGPKESAALNAVDPRLENTLEFSGWFAPIAKLFLAILIFLYGFLHNYGLAIIALTILVKLLLLPMTIKSAQSMKKSGDLQKKMNYIKQRYKNDPEALAREQEALIRQSGMPWIGGCLPMLIQIPIFFALRNVLYGAIELYQAPFGLWIHDLSEPDPYYILPLLMVIAMLAQAMTVEAKQRFQFMLLAIVVGAVMVNVSAGITLYFVLSTVLGLLQQTIQNKLKI